MQGEYHTTTLATGASTLNIKATLLAPEPFQKDQNHHAIWAIGSKTHTEWLMTSYEILFDKGVNVGAKRHLYSKTDK